MPWELILGLSALGTLVLVVLILRDVLMRLVLPQPRPAAPAATPVPVTTPAPAPVAPATEPALDRYGYAMEIQGLDEEARELGVRLDVLFRAQRNKRMRDRAAALDTETGFSRPMHRAEAEEPRPRREQQPRREQPERPAPQERTAQRDERPIQPTDRTEQRGGYAMTPHQAEAYDLGATDGLTHDQRTPPAHYSRAQAWAYHTGYDAGAERLRQREERRQPAPANNGRAQDAGRPVPPPAPAAQPDPAAFVQS